MKADQAKCQWAMTVVVLHSPRLGHEVRVLTQSQGRDPVSRSGGSWKGLGLPEPVLSTLRAFVDSTLTEHLMTRYGIQGELPMTWAGEPEPF